MDNLSTSYVDANLLSLRPPAHALLKNFSAPTLPLPVPRKSLPPHPKKNSPKPSHRLSVVWPTPRHNIIRIHNNVQWDWQYSTKCAHIHNEYRNILCNIHITLLWIFDQCYECVGALQLVFQMFSNFYQSICTWQDLCCISKCVVKHQQISYWKLALL